MNKINILAINIALCFGMCLIGGMEMLAKKTSLKTYTKKRDFKKTPEPSGKKTKKKTRKEPIFVVQKHDASHLHYDFRLEIDGVLVSWAIPKGPSTSPNVKHLAVMTEDHPMDYASFEGIIPEGQYGGGTVMVWDNGTYTNLKEEYGISMKKALQEGKIEIELHGKKLQGSYALIRTKLHGDERNWLFFKTKSIPTKKSAVIKNEKSVLTDRTMKQIAQEQTKKKKSNAKNK